MQEKNKYNRLKEILANTSYINKLLLDVFDVLNITTMEIRHSRVLGWLLNPNASHYTTVFLRRFLRYFQIKKLKYDKIQILFEKDNIDILIVDKYSRNKHVIAIENKVKSKQHDNQLERYKKILDKKYKGYEKLLIYLCKNDNEEIDENWEILTYQDIDKILFSKRIKDVDQKTKDFIYNYKIVIERRFSLDSKEKKECLAIYKENKEIIDTIYAYAEEEGLTGEKTYVNMVEEVLEELHKKKKVIYNPSIKNCDISFFTPKMDKYLGKIEKKKVKGSNRGLGGSWRKGTCYFYWFRQRKENIELIFEIGKGGKHPEELSNSQHKKLEKIIKYSDGGLRDAQANKYKRIKKFIITDYNKFDENKLKSEIKTVIEKMLKYEEELLIKVNGK